MRYAAWIMFGIAALILIGSIPVSMSFWNVYGYPESFSEYVSDAAWTLGLAAVPALAGYLMLRIANNGSRD